MDRIGDLVPRLERGSLEPAQLEEWRRRVAGVSSERFGQTATDAVRQEDSRQYRAHLRAAEAGLNSIGNLAAEQRVELVRALIEEQTRLGLAPEEIVKGSGVPDLNADNLSAGQLIDLLAWLQVNHPEVIGSAAARFKDRPEILSHLLGAQTLLMIVTNLDAGLPGESR